MNILDPNTLVGNIVMGWVRHAISGFAGGLVADGILTQQQSTDAIGAVLFLIPIFLSGYQKWAAQQKINAAILAKAAKP